MAFATKERALFVQVRGKFVMLTIRPEQFTVFEEHAIKQANLKLVEYSRNRFPEIFHSTTNEHLISFVSTVRRRAESHDIKNDRDIATAIDFTIMFEDDFYEAVWARDIFSIASWSGEEKMRLLKERVKTHITDYRD